MPSTRRTARTLSTVLGKRASRAVVEDAASPVESTGSDALLTPENTPKAKRPRTSIEEDNSRSNKENIPPFRLESISRPASPRPRTVSRTTTEPSVGRTPQSSLRRSATGLLPTTPATALSGLSLATPPDSPPTALIPLHVRARGLLRATCNSTTTISGRSSEREVITKFLTSFIAPASDNVITTTLYVSGLPGTGKTALVNDIIRNMDMNDVILVNLNCMALNNADALWDRLQEDLGVMKKTRGRGRAKKLDAKTTVETILEGSSTKCVLILDELDHIAPSTGSLASLFSMVHDHRNNIRVIGIANTHTLTSAGSIFDGVAGVETLHFSAYSGEDLFKIIQTRLAPLYDDEEQAVAMKKFLPLPALNLLSKKVAAQTGDVRATFEVLRGAIDVAVMASSVTDAPIVTPANVLSALKLYSPSSAPAPSVAGASTASSGLAANSQLAAQVRQLGLQQRLVLLAIVLSTQRVQAGLSLGMTTPIPPKSLVKRSRSSSNMPAASASSSMDSSAIHAYYSSVLTRGEGAMFNPVARSEFVDLLGMLETVGLVTLSTSSVKPARQMSRAASFKASPSKSAAAGARAQDVKLAEGVRLDEVLRGLGCQGAPSAEASADSREEEVRVIFEREQARIAREVKSRTPSTETDVFADALED